MTAPFVFESSSEEATATFGRLLAQALPDGSTIALNGTLGAGKTRLVQAVAAELGINRADVVSPTFVLMQEYHGRKSIFHLDAYRLRDEDEYLGLGVEDYVAGRGLVFIEWAERIERCLPPDRLEINIQVTGPESRQFEVFARGAPFDEVVARLEREWLATK